MAFHVDQINLVSGVKFGASASVAKRLGVKNDVNLEFLLNDLVVGSPASIRKAAQDVIDKNKLKVAPDELVKAIKTKSALPKPGKS